MSRKSFTVSEDFLTAPEPESKETTGEKEPGLFVPEGYKLVQESKTARIQLLITPTMKANVKRVAEAKGVSVNQLYEDVMMEYLLLNGGQ